MLRKFILLLVISCGFTCCILTPETAAGEYSKTTSAYSHYLMALIYEYSQDIEAAIDEYKKVGYLDYYSFLVHSKLAANYIRLGRLNDAEVELKKLIKLEPQNLEARFVLALVYTALKKLDEADKEYEYILKSASTLEPKNIEVYKSLALLYYQQRRLDEAIRQYQKVLSLSDRDSEAHFFLGIIYEEKGSRRLAIEELKKAVALNPKDGNALNSLGYIYALERKNLDEAENLIRQAIELEPQNGAYIDSLGWVYFQKGMLDDAIKELERASGLLNDPVIHEHLADAYFKKGLIDKAKEEWQESLRLNPNQQKVKEKLKKALKKCPSIPPNKLEN